VASFWGLSLLPLLAACAYRARAWQGQRRRQRRSLQDAGADEAHRPTAPAAIDGGGNGAGITAAGTAAGRKKNQVIEDRKSLQGTPPPPPLSQKQNGHGGAAHNHPSTHTTNNDDDSSSIHALEAPLLPSSTLPSLPPSLPPPWPILFTRETLLLLHLTYLTYRLLTLLDPSLHPPSSFPWQHALVVRLGGMAAWMLVVEGEEEEAAERGREEGGREGGGWGLGPVYVVGGVGAWWTLWVIGRDGGGGEGGGGGGASWWGEPEVGVCLD